MKRDEEENAYVNERNIEKIKLRKNEGAMGIRSQNETKDNI